jgi:hypothetical protein
MAIDTSRVTLEEIIRLTVDQVNGYLGRMDAEHPCAACGHDGWTIDYDDGRVIFVSTPLAHNPRNGMAFLPLTCDRCANTRFINGANIAADVIKHEAAHAQD